MQYKDNTILVVPSSIKKDVLINQKKLSNIRIFSIDEFIKKFYFDYNEKTIYYVSKKYNVIPEIAKIYLNNLYFVKAINHSKIKFLSNLKKELIKENLLIENKLFKEMLKGKEIQFFEIPKSLFNLKLIEELKKESTVTIVEEEQKNYKHKYRHFINLEDEVVYVASKICELINSGVNINNIYITNISEEHCLVINRIFNLFKIPFSLKNRTTIYSTPIITKFIDNYDSNIEKTLSLLSGNITTKEDEYIYNSLLDIINKYYFTNDYNDVKDMIINDIKNIKTYEKFKVNCIREVNFIEHNFNDNDYVFLLHFNQGIIPKIYKDENYLSDDLMRILELDTSYFKNNLEKQITVDKIKNIKNLFITYIDKTIKDSFYPSSLIEELNLEEDKTPYNQFKHSHNYNKIKLKSFTDTYKKYSEINESLPLLDSNYKLDKYNNQYSKISKENLQKYIDNTLYLSYTSLNNYYKCSFRYYLSNILKLDIYEDTFMQIVGDIFHYVLENYFKKEKTYDELYKNAINSMQYNYNIKELFFLKKLKKELKFVIDTIEYQNTFSSLNEELYEENIVTNIEGNISIKFSGKIDKLKYIEKDNETIIAIIDYKTGNPELNIDNITYGLDMQLPIYIYLAKNSNKLKNIKVAGFYLQKILNNEIVADNKHSYETLKKEKLKLQGYSNSDIEILKIFDSSYQNSDVIKSLSMSEKGFGHHSKILSTDKMNELVKVVENNIKEASKHILDCDFSINPKAINNKNIGCEYCKYKSICYMKEEDVINLNDDIGGDNNANLD